MKPAFAVQASSQNLTVEGGAPGRGLGPPGWHGKLPALGDFVSRRLGAEFIEPWDTWLSAGLHRLSTAAPSQWLQQYLQSPSWRFLLQPGALPGGGAASQQAWAGVLMPSVDRVGRYFPLTLALPLGLAAPNRAQLQGLWRSLTAWDDLARNALHDDWTAEQLEAELQRHHAAYGAWGDQLATAAVWPDAGPACDLPTIAGQALPVAGAADAAAAMLAQLQPQAWRVAQGCSWWQAVPDEGPPRLWLVRGLPTDLSLLFAGGTTV